MLDRVHKIAEIISAFAIVGSLIFVGIQLLQNTNAVEVSNAQAGINSWNVLSLAIVTDDELMQAHIDAAYPEYRESDVDVNARRMQFFARATLRTVETLYLQWREGNLPDQLWTGYRHALIASFNFNRVYSEVWLNFRPGVSPEFRAYVDGLQAEGAKIRAKVAAAAK